MARERRTAERVDVSIQGAFFVAREQRTCELRNLSSCGVLFRAPVHHLDDPRVHIRFEVPEHEEPISVAGLVVRKRRSGLESEWGIHLAPSAPEEVEVFEEFVVRTLARQTEAGRSPNRPLRVLEPAPTLDSLYDAALRQLEEDDG